ncbi:hypothetical protein [Paenibacillus sp. N3.4]|uniref:hypothetical protein n=1 Tax=Paenibacillus sp. N3.4 TaxID=2603222 RepID=UPI0011CA158B|nr:hypothetical protein [Paenibacillus sp. N3.4]TXK77673.1 hypothetical protein FU659_22285 [Paenibacillus sp. N3.4]
MDKRKLTLFALIIFIVLLNVIASFRWSYNNSEGDMKYKTDRWTNKVWVEYYPPLAITNGIEVPLLNTTKFDSDTQLEAHIKKNAVSGYLVSEWLERMKLTYLYYGSNAFLIFNILLLLAMIIRTRKSTTRNTV